MSTLRKVERVVKGVPAVDGAGVQLVRVLGPKDTKDFDPFLMLDAFDSHDRKITLKVSHGILIGD